MAGSTRFRSNHAKPKNKTDIQFHVISYLILMDAYQQWFKGFWLLLMNVNIVGFLRSERSLLEANERRLSVVCVRHDDVGGRLLDDGRCVTSAGGDGGGSRQTRRVPTQTAFVQQRHRLKVCLLLIGRLR